MNLKDERQAALTAAKQIALAVKSAGRGFTSSEAATVDQHLAKADELGKQIKAAEDSAALLARIGAIQPGDLEGEAGNLFSESDAKGFIQAARSKSSFGT